MNLSKDSNLSFLSLFPAIITLLSFFVPSLTYPMKIIVPLALTGIYFLSLSIFLQVKYNRSNTGVNTLKDELEQTEEKIQKLKLKLDNYQEFVHKRELFITHDISEIQDLINEYNVYVNDKYRGNKYQDLRSEITALKKRNIEIIHKEKRDFSEQLYKIQSNKNN